MILKGAGSMNSWKQLKRKRCLKVVCAEMVEGTRMDIWADVNRLTWKLLSPRHSQRFRFLWETKKRRSADVEMIPA